MCSRMSVLNAALSMFICRNLFMLHNPEQIERQVLSNIYYSKNLCKNFTMQFTKKVTEALKYQKCVQILSKLLPQLFYLKLFYIGIVSKLSKTKYLLILLKHLHIFQFLVYKISLQIIQK